MSFRNDLTGKKFGKLTVIGFSHKETKTYRSSERKSFVTTYYWKCKCDCGNTILIRSSNLISGNTRSCGCNRDEYLKIKKNNMGFKFPVLDTSDVSDSEEYNKFIEEVDEFKEAIGDYYSSINNNETPNKENVLEELFDVIQVGVNLIDRLDITKQEKEEAYKKHIDKMIKRGWTIKTYM